MIHFQFKAFKGRWNAQTIWLMISFDNPFKPYEVCTMWSGMTPCLPRQWCLSSTDPWSQGDGTTIIRGRAKNLGPGLKRHSVLHLVWCSRDFWEGSFRRRRSRSFAVSVLKIAKIKTCTWESLRKDKHLEHVEHSRFYSLGQSMGLKSLRPAFLSLFLVVRLVSLRHAALGILGIFALLGFLVWYGCWLWYGSSWTCCLAVILHCSGEATSSPASRGWDENLGSKVSPGVGSHDSRWI